MWTVLTLPLSIVGCKAFSLVLPCTRSGFERVRVSLSGMYARGKNTSKSWRGWAKAIDPGHGVDKQMTFPHWVFLHSLLPRLLPFQRCEAKSNLVKGSNTCRGSNGLQRHFGMNVLWGNVYWDFMGSESWRDCDPAPTIRGRDLLDLCSLWLPCAYFTKKRLFATFGRSKDFQHQQPCACHRKFIIHKISKQSCKHSNIKTWCFILTLDKSKSPWKGDWIRILGTDPLLVVWSSFVDRRPASGFSITPRWGFQCNRHRSTAYKWLDSSMCIFACATLRLGEAKMEGSKNLTCRNAFPWKHVETNEIFSEVLQETNVARSVFETKISVESSR